MGHEQTYDSFQVVAGAPGWSDGLNTVGVVAQTYLAKLDGALTKLYSVGPITGSDAMALTGQDLGFGTLLHVTDVTGGGAGQRDLVVGAPGADVVSSTGADRLGGFAWTKAQFSSAPVFPPTFFKWTFDPASGQLGWPGDTMEVFALQLSGLTDFGVSMFSETNHVWALSAQGSCIELPINTVNLTQEQVDYGATLPPSWTESSSYLYECGGDSVAGWTGHVMEAGDVCDPAFVDTGDPWPRQFYSHAPLSKCGNPKERLMYPITKVTPDTVPLVHEVDVRDLLIDSTSALAFTDENLGLAAPRFLLTPDTAMPPTEVVLTLDFSQIEYSGPVEDLEFNVNNAPWEDASWTLEATADTWACE